MQRRLLSIFAATIILLMVLPPVFNTFDRWDRKPELPLVGHDTETTVMMMALETAVGLAVAWGSVLLLACLAAVFVPGLIALAAPRTRRGFRATDYLLMLFSPPWRPLSLRI